MFNRKDFILRKKGILSEEDCKRIIRYFETNQTEHKAGTFGGGMKRHTDRNAGEYAVSLCLSKDGNYPLYFERTSGKVKAYELDPGDLVLYHGIEWPHWRPKYKGRRHIQAFLCYVDKNGQYTEHKMDGRAGLMYPPREGSFLYAK